MSASPALDVPIIEPLATHASIDENPPQPDNSTSAINSVVHGSGPKLDIQALRAEALKSAQGKKVSSKSDSQASSPSSVPVKVSSRVVEYTNAEAGPSSKPIITPSISSALHPTSPARPRDQQRSVSVSEEGAEADPDKEEGEICEEEPVSLKQSERGPGPRNRPIPIGPRSKGRRPSEIKLTAKTSPKQRRASKSSDTPNQGHPQASLPNFGPTGDQKGKAKESVQTQTQDQTLLASAAPDISPAEAQQYMDIIRNLLFEGFTPETLIQRGATHKYVVAVCEDIVEGTKKRKALWLETREQNRADSEAPSIAPTIPRASEGRKSNSPEVEVLITAGRDLVTRRAISPSSESSAEYTLVERMSPKKAGLSFHSPPSADITVNNASAHSRPASFDSQPVKVESYKPQPSARSQAAQTMHHPLSPASLSPLLLHASSPILRPGPTATPITSQGFVGIPAPAIVTSSRLPLSVSGPSLTQPFPRALNAPNLPSKPPHSQRRGRKRSDRAWDEGLDKGSDVVLNYGDEDARQTMPVPLPPKPLSERLGPPRAAISAPTPVMDPPPMAPLESPPPSPPPLPEVSATLVPKAEDIINTTSAQRNAEIALKTALLESRRKALDSMRRRRAAVEPQSIDASPPVALLKTQTNLVEPVSAVEINKSIEEQMADIEKEVLDIQASSAGDAPDAVSDMDMDADVDMDIDEPEEGEIIPSTAPTPPSAPHVNMPPSSTSLPIPPRPRGVKRLHAEDLMEGKTTSVPSRPPPSSRRRLFGVVQRPQRLILHLDDSSDSSDDEADVAPTPPPDPDILATQRLLAEKEASIQRLRDEIAAKMKARVKKKLELKSQRGSVPPQVMQSNESGGIELPRGAVDGKSSGATGAQSPLPADIRRLSKELVKAEAEVEAMDVDNASAVSAQQHVETPSTATVEHTQEDADDESRHRSVSPSVIQTVRSDSDKIDDTAQLSNISPLLPRYPQLNQTPIETFTFAQIDNLPQGAESAKAEAANIAFDRHLLDSVILTNRMKIEPELKVCAAEMGGGMCADRTCTDVHLSKGLVPTGKFISPLIGLFGRRGGSSMWDDDLIEYIFQVGSGFPNLPRPTETIRNALSEAQKITSMTNATGVVTIGLESDDMIQLLSSQVVSYLKRKTE